MRLLILSLLLSAPAHAGKKKKALKQLETFREALSARDWDAAASHCSEAFRTRDSLSCDALVGELRRGATLEWTATHPGYPQTLTEWNLMQGPDVVPVWLMVERTDDGLRFVDGRDIESRRSQREVPKGDSPRHPDLDDGAHAVILAINSGDPMRLQAHATPELTSAEADSTADIAEQIAGKAIRLDVSTVRTEGDRTLATALVVVEEVVRDEVYLYLEKRDGDWKLAALDEDDTHAQAWLTAGMPAVLPAAGTDVPPGFAAFEASLTDALRSDATADTFPGSLAPSWLEELRAGGEIADPKHWWFDSAKTGFTCWARPDTSLLAILEQGEDGTWQVHRYATSWSGCTLDWSTLLVR
jgi:hypothetical protein